MNLSETSSRYDRYWEAMDSGRAAARSVRRARLALGLLGPRRGRLLEVGCGPGWALETFRDAGFEVSGIDVSPVAVEMARGRGLDVRVADGTRDEIPGGFEVVAALEVLEHVPEPLDLLCRLAPAVTPGGALLVSLPNEFTLPRRLGILLGRPGFAGHDDPHLRHFHPASARRLFRAAGLEVARSAWDGLLPPRWKFLKRLTEPLATWLPGLFALSGVHLLEIARPAGEAEESRR